MDPSEVQVCNTCGRAGTGFRRCSRCVTTIYCGKECQKQDWKKHKPICTKLNASEGKQIHHSDHKQSQQQYDAALSCLAGAAEGVQKVFRIFLHNPDTPETIMRMKKLLRKESTWTRHTALFMSITFLLHLPKEMVLRRSSPLLVALGSGCDPNYMSRPSPPKPRDNRGSTALHWLAESAVADNFETHENQVIMARQLIEAGANVNARAGTDLDEVSPLHRACHSSTVTNLGLIRLLLSKGADPNQKTRHAGETPLMHTLLMSMSAAKLLLTFPQVEGAVPIDVNVRSANGSTFLGSIRSPSSRMKIQMGELMGQLPPDSSTFLLKQFDEIEKILVEKGAVDGGWRDIIHNPEGPSFTPPPTLPFTVSKLLDKDLLKEGPEWYKELPFWIDDAMSMGLEGIQKKNYLHSGFKNDVYSGVNKKVAVGFAVQIKVKLPHPGSDGRLGHLTGSVTEVGTEPTAEELRKNGSYLFEVAIGHELPEIAFTASGSRESLLQKFGALHGQEVTARVSLAAKDASRELYTSYFLGPGTLFDVVLRCNDGKQNQWEMVRIHRVSN